MFHEFETTFPPFFRARFRLEKKAFFSPITRLAKCVFFSHRLYIISSVGLCVCPLVFSVRSFHTIACHLCRLHFITTSLFLKRNYLSSLSLCQFAFRCLVPFVGPSLYISLPLFFRPFFHCCGCLDCLAFFVVASKP